VKKAFSQKRGGDKEKTSEGKKFRKVRLIDRKSDWVIGRPVATMTDRKEEIKGGGRGEKRKLVGGQKEASYRKKGSGPLIRGELVQTSKKEGPGKSRV